MLHREPPASTEHGEYYGQYIAKVGEKDLLDAFRAQDREIEELLGSIGAPKESFRYAEGKWTVKEVLGHLIDSERVFLFRALSFARGETQSLPGFEENDYVAESRFDGRPLASIAAELRAVRSASVAFFEGLDPEVWTRVGTANGQPMSPRAAGYVVIGHMRHHFGVLRERYL